MNIGGVITNDLANGPGIRISVFVSGCENNCAECHNPELWDYGYGTPMTDKAIDKIISSLNEDGIKRGLSILGGDPLMPKNQKDVLYLVKKIRKAIPDINIWLWTGFSFDSIKNLEILKYIDTVVDGKFIKELKSGSHLWRGSSNQQIWHKINNYWQKEDTNV